MTYEAFRADPKGPLLVRGAARTADSARWGSPEPPKPHPFPIFDARTDEHRVLRVPETLDFGFAGTKDAPPWRQTRWTSLVALDDGHGLTTGMKCLHSKTGLYLLFDATDDRLSTRMKDGEDLWLGDSLEIFICPDTSRSTYLQYVLSPLGAELVLMVPNHGGVHVGWTPWRYDGPRRIRSQVATRGGPREAFAAVTGWTAEVFVPYALLTGLISSVPEAGTTWRANFYRVDYRPEAAPARWAFCDRTGANTHDFHNYGVLQFA